MTKRECLIVSAYTGIIMFKNDDLNYFYEYVSSLMGRNVYTHELVELADEIKEKSKPDFIRLCAEATE